MHLIFQHGWGFDSSCWRGWLALLGSPCLLGDRGYWGAPCPLEPLAPSPGFVLVAHSLGFHLLTAEFLARAALVVVIGGFAHFHGPSAADGRFSRRHIHRMLSRIQDDPGGLIRAFHRDCDYTGEGVNTAPLDLGLLTQDLHLLDQSRVEKGFCQGLPPLLLLHGREDRIVRPERAEELAAMCQGSQLILIEKAGHGLPFTHPSICLDLIRAAYERLVPLPPALTAHARP